MKTTIRTGNLIIIILILLGGIFYFSGAFESMKNILEDHETEQVKKELKISDSLLSVYMIQNYDLVRKLKKYDTIPNGISRISKERTGIIRVLPDYKIPLDKSKDSAAYFQGYNDALMVDNVPKFSFSDTTYWFISYHANKNVQTVRKVYSNEIIVLKGDFILKDVIKNLENKYKDYIKPNTIIITFYKQTTKINYSK